MDEWSLESPEVPMDWNKLCMLVLDVDGVLTDGRLVYDADGQPVKTFHAQDGCALRLWLRAGRRAAILSGRSSGAADRRGTELGLHPVCTGVADKVATLDEMLAEADLSPEQAIFIGDDIPDLGAMARCGWTAVPADATPIAKRQADYVARRGGGAGAVAEVVEYVMRKQGVWSAASASPPTVGKVDAGA
jgi:3-deoxy-D-manno-octulosonate 8-phosphate phosphatase (KDO 8-P phosphatase)